MIRLRCKDLKYLIPTPVCTSFKGKHSSDLLDHSNNEHFCLLIEWHLNIILNGPLFRCRSSNSTPFKDRTHFHHLNTEQVWYPDPHFLFNLLVNQFFRKKFSKLYFISFHWDNMYRQRLVKTESVTEPHISLYSTIISHFNTCRVQSSAMFC